MRMSKVWIGFMISIGIIVSLSGCTGVENVTEGSDTVSSDGIVSSNEVSVVETFEKADATDSYEEWIMHTYYKMSDGTWSVDIVDNETGEVETLTYQYRIVLHDRMPNAEVDSNYIILSNRNDITFYEAYMASGLSSNLEDYFTKDEAVFVSSWAGPLEANHPVRDSQTIYVLGDNWGIDLQVTNITSSGLTIECMQSGGNPTGELQTGSYYVVQKKTDSGWEALEYIIDNVGWTEEAWMILENETVSWDVDWEWCYGKLPEGDYRIGKEIVDFRGSGDYDKQMYYVEFGI